MARKKCSEGCGSYLVDGHCPTPELHGMQGGVRTTTDKREEESLKKAADLETKRAELERDKAAVRAAQRDLKNLLAEVDRASEMKSIILDMVQQVEPVKLPPKKRDGKLPTHEWVLVLSDWHIGQLTTLAETGGLFEQSTTIALDQAQTLWDAVDHVHEIESKGRSIKKLVILSLGDMVDGDLMRVSQTKKTDMVVAEQYPIMYALMEALVKQALTRFDEVEINVVGGNHDRFGKFGDAALGELAYIDNWSFVMGTALEQAFGQEPRVKVRNHQSFFGTTIVSGRKFVFSHGSDVNWRTGSYGGVPYYALANAGKLMRDMVGHYDAYVMGHGHTAMTLPIGSGSRIILNGSLPGSSTFVQSKMKSIRRPSQTLIALHHEKGITGVHELWLDHEGIKPEEDAWGEVEETGFTVDLTPTRKKKA